MSLRTLAGKSVVVPLIACTAMAGALAAAADAPQAQAQSRSASPVALPASAAPAAPAGSVRLGGVTPGTKLSIEVTLNIPDEGALNAFLSGLTDPRSPDYQRFLQPGQFGPRFGPSLAQVAAVESALRSAGLRPGRVSANRLAIPVTATAAQLDRALHVAIDSYRLPGGRVAYANAAAPSFPAAVAPLVQGVLGLNDLYPEQPMGQLSHPATEAPMALKIAKGAARTNAKGVAQPQAAAASGPQPCALASESAITANTFAAVYGMNLLYAMGDLGKGVRVGVLELEPNLTSDIAAYEKCYKISTKVNYIKVDGGVGTGAGEGEAALDIETIAGFVPDATIDVYQAPNKGDGFYDIFKKFVTSDTDKVLSSSWGACEAETGEAAAQAEETLFKQANAQGQVIFSAAGDEGSTGCYDPEASKANDTLSPVSPASSPYVLGVGGTSFANSEAADQVVWNDSSLDSGAGGGGVSTLWCMPSYQHQTKIPGIVNAHSVRDTSSSCPTKYRREVPDISANADPLYGYAVYYDGSWALLGIGGTSAATPLWASVASLSDVSPFCVAYGSKAPFLPQNLYQAVAAYHSYVYAKTPQVLRDITSGNNDYTPSGYTGGLYPAGKGYDMASGLGAPMVSGLSGDDWYSFLAGLTQVLCHQSATKLKTVKITGVSPDSGKAGKTTKVTVSGSGFLPIASADEAYIMSGSKVLKVIAASCTATECHFTMPAEKAQTVDIKIYAESLWSSPGTSADHFTYKS